MKLMQAVIAFTLLMLLSPSYSQVLETPGYIVPAGQTAMGGIFASSEVDYDSEDDTAEIERKIFGIVGEYGLQTDMAVFGQLGKTFDAEIDDFDGIEGDGFTVGLGAKYVFNKTDAMRFAGYAAFTRIDEEYDGGGAEAELVINEITLGAAGIYHLNPTVDLFAGLEIIPYSDGEVEIGSIDIDIERDDLVNLRLGANAAINERFVVHPEITFMSETTLGLSGHYLF